MTIKKGSVCVSTCCWMEHSVSKDFTPPLDPFRYKEVYYFRHDCVICELKKKGLVLDEGGKG